MSLAEIMAILAGWEGTPMEKLQKWHETNNFIIWPPPDDDVPKTEREAAVYIFNCYDPPPGSET